METIIVKICRYGIGIAFSILIFAVLLQVFGRIFLYSVVWTEELTRYALLYVAAFGAGLTLRSGALVNVDVICESLPDYWSRLLRLLSALLTAILCGILIEPAFRYVSIGRMQTSSAMGLRMDFVHFSVLLLLITLMLFGFFRVFLMIFHKNDGLPVDKSEVL